MSKYEIMLEKLEKQQEEFYERTRNCDVKLGFILALLSAIIIYIMPNLELTHIFSKEWINENGLGLFSILLLVDLAILSLLYIALFYALVGIKAKIHYNIGPRYYGKSNMKCSKKKLLVYAIEYMEKNIEKNLKAEDKKNKQFNISLILTIISMGLIIAEFILKIFV